jgi:hypothetical protein
MQKILSFAFVKEIILSFLTGILGAIVVLGIPGLICYGMYIWLGHIGVIIILMSPILTVLGYSAREDWKESREYKEIRR